MNVMSLEMMKVIGAVIAHVGSEEGVGDILTPLEDAVDAAPDRVVQYTNVGAAVISAWRDSRGVVRMKLTKEPHVPTGFTLAHGGPMVFPEAGKRRRRISEEISEKCPALPF